MSEKQNLTAVNVTGVATAKYDTAIFNCTTEGTAKTGPLAKEKARPAIDALLAALKSLEGRGIKIDRASLKTTFEVQPATEYDGRKQIRVGYTASYTLTFKSESVDRASEVHDCLTGIEDVVAHSPSFKIKNINALHSKAFRDAIKKRDARFNDECKALGLDPAEYVMADYSTRYDESESAGRSPSGGGARMFAAASLESAPSAAPVKVEAGKSSVQVTLVTNYRSRTVFDNTAVGKTKGAKPAKSATAGDNGTDATS